ncbi:hypothetical protein PS850_06126 [Pseudomonas fluorescens]|nr:hypothetical protein PS850_06126 [Pseudomonas fluorescens]
MGIIGVRESKAMRATAAVTLMTMLSGCVAPGLAGLGGSSGNENGGGTGGWGDMASTGGLASLNQKFGGALASIGGVNDQIGSIASNLGLPGGKPGFDHREWTQADQDKALAVKAFFDGKGQTDGKAFDGLPQYDPRRPGEKDRYTREINRVVEKYKSHTSLNPDEMMELANTVLPVLRYLANSRAYRAAKAQTSGASVKLNTRGQSVASLEVPPMTSVELAVTLYCNDRGLPAPWSGMALAPRPTANYMPADLQPIYKDVHHYAATNPRGHYGTQSLVWWLRHTPCENERLGADGKQLLESASPGAGLKMQTFCMKDKLKKEVLSRAGGFLPVGTGQFTEYKNMLGYLQDTQQKAAVVLGADFSNPADLLNLVQTAGFRVKSGKDSLLQNESLRSVLPALQKSGIIESMVPRNMDERATEATMSVLQQLGEEMGRKYGGDPNSVANYAELPNGLLMKTDGHKVIIHNPTPKPQTFDNTDVVLSNVDDSKFTGKQERSPVTQRYSIGPMVPTAVAPPKNEDDKFNVKSEKEIEEMIAKLGELKGDLAVDATKAGDKHDPYECPKEHSGTPKVAPKEYKISVNEEVLGTLSDVVEAIPFVGNVLAGYNALTGRHWLTGKKLDNFELAVAAITAVTPGSNTVGKVLSLGSRVYRVSKKAVGFVDTAAQAAARSSKIGSIAKGSDTFAYGAPALEMIQQVGKYNDGDKCALLKGLASGASAAACAMSSTPTCMVINLGKAGTTRVDSVIERYMAASSQQGDVLTFDSDRVAKLAKEANDDGSANKWKGFNDAMQSPFNKLFNF